MSKFIKVFCLTLALSICAFGQPDLSVSQATFISPSEQQIITLNREFADALWKRDITALERILADDYTDTDTFVGTTKSKRHIIDEYKANPNPLTGSFGKWESFDIENPVISVHGNMAVLSSRQIIKGKTQNGKSYTSRSLVTTVFTKKNRKWRIIATHGRNFDCQIQASR